MSGKGSSRRPTDAQKFAQGWDAVFGKKERIKEIQDDIRNGIEMTCFYEPKKEPVQVCSFPFCECPKSEWQELLQCSKGLPWKKEEK